MKPPSTALGRYENGFHIVAARRDTVRLAPGGAKGVQGVPRAAQGGGARAARRELRAANVHRRELPDKTWTIHYLESLGFMAIGWAL